LFISTQTTSPLFALPSSGSAPAFDAEPIQEVFEKCLSNLELAQGLGYVMGRYLGKAKIEEMGLGKREARVVKEGVEVARAVVGRAI
jgi:hypothetical protein